MKKFLIFTSLLHLTAMSLCASPEATRKDSTTTYDQRQVGKYNVHFNIKDVSIIAIGSDDLTGGIGDSDSYSDYDYDYEESEYTVSPITADLSGRPTTKKPNVTNPIQPSIAGLNLSLIATSTDSSPPLSSAKPVVIIYEKRTTTNANDTISENSTVSYQPDEIPVQVIVEPVLKPKLRLPQSAKRRLAYRKLNDKSEDIDDERIRPRRAQIAERIRFRRAQAQNRLLRNGNINGCNKGEVLDGQGGCRRRRSGMSGLLGFLTNFLPRDRE